MRILIAEDDFASRKFMQTFLSKFGECDVAVDGTEALEAYQMAYEADEAYDLICLDIMMPEMDGYQTLKAIRDMETINGVAKDESIKVIMTTALNEGKNVTKAFDLGCIAYAGKPIDQDKFTDVLRKLELID